MSLSDAVRRAYELIDQEGKTHCVFAKRSTHKGKIQIDFVAGSAYTPPPRGYKLHMWVSVTGLERLAAGWGS